VADRRPKTHHRRETSSGNGRRPSSPALSRRPDDNDSSTDGSAALVMYARLLVLGSGSGPSKLNKHIKRRRVHPRNSYVHM
jgi:hypothetical protein